MNNKSTYFETKPLHLEVIFLFDAVDYTTTFRSRIVGLAVFYAKDIYILSNEWYAAWWPRDDKSQASTKGDIREDPQNNSGVAPEGMLNKLYHLCQWLPLLLM